MKERKLLDALNEIDEEFIEEAEPENEKVISLKWIRNVACFILVIGVGISIWYLTRKPEPEIIVDDPTEITLNTEKAENEYTFEEETAENEYSFIEEGVMVPIDEEYWKNAPITEKFEVVKYNSIKYQYQSKEIIKENIGRKIASVTVESVINNPAQKTTTATLYNIKNIDSSCAVCVKFEEKDSYYVYTNRSCKFETLDEIIDKLNLKETLEISKSIYSKDDTCILKYKPIDEAIVWSMLLDDTSLKIVENPIEIRNADFEVYFTIPEIYPPSYLFNSFKITKDGYLSVFVLENDYVFFIGKDKAEKFIEYVTENYEGKVNYYTTENNASPG